jgi:hypothetical protein
VLRLGAHKLVGLCVRKVSCAISVLSDTVCVRGGYDNNNYNNDIMITMIMCVIKTIVWIVKTKMMYSIL